MSKSQYEIGGRARRRHTWSTLIPAADARGLYSARAHAAAPDAWLCRHPLTSSNARCTWQLRTDSQNTRSESRHESCQSRMRGIVSSGCLASRCMHPVNPNWYPAAAAAFTELVSKDPLGYAMWVTPVPNRCSSSCRDPTSSSRTRSWLSLVTRTWLFVWEPI